MINRLSHSRLANISFIALVPISYFVPRSLRSLVTKYDIVPRAIKLVSPRLSNDNLYIHPPPPINALATALITCTKAKPKFPLLHTGTIIPEGHFPDNFVTIVGGDTRCQVKIFLRRICQRNTSRFLNRTVKVQKGT